MLKIFLIKQQKLIKKIYYKLLKYTKGGSLNEEQIKKINNNVKSHKNIYEDITKITTDLKQIDEQLNNLINQINETHKLSKNIQKLENIDTKNLNTFVETYNKMINRILMPEDVRDDKDIENIKPKLSNYQKLSLIYYNLVKKTNEITNNNEFNEYILNEIDGNITKTDELIKEIDNNIVLLQNNTNDIQIDNAKLNEEINYAIIEDSTEPLPIFETLNYDLSEVKISPTKLNNIVELTKFAIEKLSVDITKLEPIKGGEIIEPKIVDSLFALTQKIKQCNIQLDILYEKTITYKLNDIRLNNFIIFLSLIIQSPTIFKEKIILVNLNKETIEKYLLIINKLLTQINSRDNNHIIKYFSQVHYIVLNYLQKMLNILNNNVKNKNYINVEKSTGSLKMGLILFENMIPILDKIPK